MTCKKISKISQNQDWHIGCICFHKEKRMQPKNFTKLSDEKLIFKDHLKILGNLTYYRVLTTADLFKVSQYPHGIKSFRKLLLKFIKHDLIGFQKDESTNTRYFYPTVKAILFYKKDQFQKYLMKEIELHRLKSYHILFTFLQRLKQLESYQSEKSYIHDSHGLNDWKLITDRRAQKKTSFFVFFGEDEIEIFSKIKTALEKSLTHQVIILSNESDYVMQELIKHYLKDYPRRIQRVYWYPMTSDLCHEIKCLKDDQIYSNPLHEVLKEDEI